MVPMTLSDRISRRADLAYARGRYREAALLYKLSTQAIYVAVEIG